VSYDISSRKILDKQKIPFEPIEEYFPVLTTDGSKIGEI